MGEPSGPVGAAGAPPRSRDARGAGPTSPFVEFKREDVEQSIPARFEQQVAKHADRLAVKAEGHQLTYAELDRLANRAAHAILARRGQAAEPIALLLRQGAPAIGGIFGVLKAGKFYLPLEPAYPRERLAHLLDDSGAQLVVTDRQHLALAEGLAGAGRQVLDLDGLDEGVASDGPNLCLSADGAALLLYTSGSTGQPKGVLQNHRNVLHHAMKMTNALRICSRDRQTLLRTYSFSGAMTDLFSTLLNGAAICPLNLQQRGIAHLAEWLIGEEITLYRSAMSVFRHFVNTLRGDEAFPRLRVIYVGGEPAHKRDVELFQAHFSDGCVLVNGLGATEFGTACQYVIGKQTPLADDPVPVGYPLPDTEVLLLDEAGQVTGRDGTGEIGIKSRYLSLGYWRRPDLTRAAFLPDPAGGDEQIYRTGDLGRLRPDGCLELLGRKDFQVKVRGHRVEIAEIERALLDLAEVEAAVVVAREDEPGDTRLVAYVVPAGQPAPAIGDLRGRLQAKLPEYMVPATFVALRSLPLTPVGKVDRSALPEPGRARPALEQAYVAPRGPLEALLAGLWAEVLDLERVGVEDAFLALGGDSLRATKLVARIRDTLNADLPFGLLFAAPTVADQATALVEHEHEHERAIASADDGLAAGPPRPPEARRAGPTNPFVPFRKEDVEQSVPARFEQQVAQYPDRLAVKTKAHRLTYAALDTLANRVAHAILARRGPRPEPVALLLEQGASAIAAIFGVLKAGKFYLPLGPAQPGLRTASILGDSQAGLIVTNTQSLARAAELTRDGRDLLNLDELSPTLAAEAPRRSPSPDSLAWVLYTSGSTGQPKGVVQNHRNVLHFTMNYTNGLRIGPHDRLSLLFFYGVNAGAHEIFSALLNGASIHPIDPRAEGLAPLAGWLVEEQISRYASVPTVFRAFADTLSGQERFPDLRLIKLVGESVGRRDLELYRRHFAPGCLLLNRLGSTETGSIAWYFIDARTRIDGPRVPVGHPTPDHEILLLDEAEAEVGPGEVGEMVVRSRYLSPGYWRRPELTEGAFRPDPGGGEERLYRTGDLGYRLPDGRLVHAGRKDLQVKIRGHRIEVDEIEGALLGLDTVKEAVVVAREHASGGQRLVAYLVPRGQPGPTSTALRRALARTLPDAMIPATFVLLDALPRAPNGKLDRRGLPEPSGARPASEVPFIAPRTPLEALLARIWADLLRLDQIGIRDELLALGGDSLLATKLVARVRDALQVELPPGPLFRAPTVADQAAALVEHLAAQTPPGELDRLVAGLTSRTATVRPAAAAGRARGEQHA